MRRRGPDGGYCPQQLSVLRVVNHWVPFDSVSWERATQPKTTDSFQWFEAAIFDHRPDETASAVHLYKFDDTLDPYLWGAYEPVRRLDEWIARRQSYRLLEAYIPDRIGPEERSRPSGLEVGG